LRNDLQDRLVRFFEDVTRSRATSGDAMLAVGSTIGPYREENEDRAAIADIRFPNDQRPPIKVAIVCDGMGGLIEGGKAASAAISAFLSTLAVGDRSLRVAASEAVRVADRSVYGMLHGTGGTTLTAIISDGREAWCTHVGDSRLYSCGADGLVLLTQDDTIQGAIHAHEGGGSEDELDNRLLQYVGVGESLTPHIFPVPMRANDTWIVTSDGAHGVGRKALESLLEGSRNAHDLVKKAVFVADALNVKDNASIAAMNQRQAPERDPPSSGTTITVSSPVRSLELWLSQTAERPSSQRWSDERQDRTAEEADHQGLPPGEPTTVVKGKGRKKSKRKSPPRKQPDDKRPMEVLFESKKADDRPS